MATPSNLCVLGLGYIGLPTASIFASNGFRVEGVDVNPAIADIVNSGDIHIEEPGLKTLVQAAIRSGNLRASTSPSPADAFIIAVPTPIAGDKRADLAAVEAATRSIVPHLRPGNLVILESTSPPGTTRDLVVPILAESGLEPGRELFVAHSPERVLPGRILHELIANHRVIGGIDAPSAERARDLYAHVVGGEIHLTDATTAETVKLMENTYRDVNIALANELAVVCGRLGVSAWEVVALANRHPRVQLHQPGPGVGGHCISVDPWFLVEALPEETPLIRLARTINDRMPRRVAALVRNRLGGVNHPKVTVLGVSYKGNVDDVRESPAEPIVEDLLADGVRVGLYDPRARHFSHELSGLEEAFSGSDCVLLLADHSEFHYLDPAKLVKLVRRPLLVDTRKTLDLDAWRKAGFETVLLGQVPLGEAVAVRGAP